MTAHAGQATTLTRSNEGATAGSSSSVSPLGATSGLPASAMRIALLDKPAVAPRHSSFIIHRSAFFLLLLLFLSLAGCTTFGGAKPQTASGDLSAEQRDWWAANRDRARYVPGKGYYVEGTSGYFDESGRQVTSSLSSGGFADEEDETEDFWSQFNGDRMKKRWKKMVGRGPNEKVARAAYAEAEQLSAARKFEDAAEKYEVAYDRWPDSPLEEEAMFRAGEARFFADHYSKAEDRYSQLTKKYPGTPEMDKISKRRFAIGQFWEKYHQHNPNWPTTPNLADNTRPLFDTQGHALRVYEQIRLDDPTGPLADDALMAMASNYFTRGRWEDADYYFGLLRNEYPKSEHQFNAHRLGLMAKLMKYQGPDYEGSPLKEADELAKQLLTQFPTELGNERERVVQTRAELRHQEALREFQTAQYYEKGEYYGASRMYYEQVAKAYPDTKLAQDARARLGEIQQYPASPEPMFSWVKDLLPASKKFGPEIKPEPTQTGGALADSSPTSKPLAEQAVENEQKGFDAREQARRDEENRSR